MSIIEELARNVVETGFDSFDKDVIERAKYRIIDVVGCAIGGAGASGCGMIADLVKKWGGAEESTIFVYGGKAPAQNAAMVNSIMCRSYDFEPVETNVAGKNFPGHISGATVPVALAMAEPKGASGRELITALVLGDDIASRILAASRFSFEQGWDGTGIVNTFGAAAIAGRFAGLDVPHLINAFGIALNQMAGTFQNIYDGTHCFKLPMGLAARSGIFSAELAGRGFTGPEDPLLSRHGYFSLYCQGNDASILTHKLGREFYADNTFKPYPACRSTHAAIECALKLVRSHDIAPENIAEISVNVTRVASDMFVGQPFRIRETPQADATFSLQYTVASVLLRKSIKMEHFTDESVRDPAIAALVPKVAVKGSLPPERPLAAGVEIRMRDGAAFSEYVAVPRGDGVDTPLTGEEIKEKFRANVDFSRTVSLEKAERALAMLEALEDITDITQIIREIS